MLPDVEVEFVHLLESWEEGGVTAVGEVVL